MPGLSCLQERMQYSIGIMPLYYNLQLEISGEMCNVFKQPVRNEYGSVRDFHESPLDKRASWELVVY